MINSRNLIASEPKPRDSEAIREYTQDKAVQDEQPTKPQAIVRQDRKESDGIGGEETIRIYAEDAETGEVITEKTVRSYYTKKAMVDIRQAATAKGYEVI